MASLALVSVISELKIFFISFLFDIIFPSTKIVVSLESHVANFVLNETDAVAGPVLKTTY